MSDETSRPQAETTHASVPRSSSRHRAIQLAQRVTELEEENARLRELSAQWVMHHAHAALGIQRIRDALAAGRTDPAELLEIVNDGEVNAGTDRFVAQIVDGLVREWTQKPIPNVSRSDVRDWLIAHRATGI